MVSGHDSRPASRMAFIWHVKVIRERVDVGHRYYDRWRRGLTSVCGARHFLCSEGRNAPSKVTAETSLCDNDNEDSINRHLWVGLVNRRWRLWPEWGIQRVWKEGIKNNPLVALKVKSSARLERTEFAQECGGDLKNAAATHTHTLNILWNIFPTFLSGYTYKIGAHEPNTNLHVNIMCYILDMTPMPPSPGPAGQHKNTWRRRGSSIHNLVDSGCRLN